MVTIDGRKTLSSLYRAITGDPCPKTAADTFRLAPWQTDDLRIPMREKLVQDALIRREAAHQKPVIFLNTICTIDSSNNSSETHGVRSPAL